MPGNVEVPTLDITIIRSGQGIFRVLPKSTEFSESENYLGTHPLLDLHELLLSVLLHSPPLSVLFDREPPAAPALDHALTRNFQSVHKLRRLPNIRKLFESTRRSEEGEIQFL